MENSIILASMKEIAKDIARVSSADWKKLGSAHILLTGGTGFFDSWIIVSFLELRKLGFPIEMTVLSRDPEKFLMGNPGLRNASGLAFRKGDVTSATIPFSISHILHFATEGTLHMLAEAKRVGAARFLLGSSGAVYGRARSDHASENQIDKDAQLTVSGKTKREAEALCYQAYVNRDIETVVLRGFTFCGPLFPTEGPYVISVFMHALLNGLPLPVKTPDSRRAFLDGRDLVTAIWRILVSGKNGEAYNVGSEESVTMLELADIFRSVAWKVSLRVPEIRKPAAGVMQSADTYLPSIAKLQNELGWSPTISLRESLFAQAEWAVYS